MVSKPVKPVKPAQTEPTDERVSFVAVFHLSMYHVISLSILIGPQPTPYRYHTVYVDSVVNTKPYCSLEEADFPGSVCKMLTRLGFQTPSLVQGCSWPIVGQGNLSILISPPLSGKTLAYLLPLATRRELARVADSSECVPQPRLIVLVASSWGAQAVFTRARDLVSALSANRRFR